MRDRRRRIAAWGALLIVMACTPAPEPGAKSAGKEAAPATPPTTAAPRELKLLLIGIDAADWELLDPCMADGGCPNLAKLAAASARGKLESPPPRISPILWTGMLTGRQPEEHGVLDFLEPVKDAPPGQELQPITSRSRKAEALWGVLTRYAVPTAVVGFWATWPAEPIDGVMVSDAFAPSLIKTAGGPAAAAKGVVYPPAWAARLRSLRDAEAPLATLMPRFVEGWQPRADAAPPAPGDEGASMIEKDPVLHLEAVLRGTLAYQRAALAILDSREVEVALVYHQMVDEVCHRFMRFAPPALDGTTEEERARFGNAVRAAYELEDRLVGELLERAGPGTAVVVVSDHGFLSGTARLATDPADFEGQAAAWHAESGILLVKAPGMAGKTLEGGVLDVAATVLGLVGIRGQTPGTPLAGIAAGPLRAERATPFVPDVGDRGGAPGAAPGAAESIDELAALGYLTKEGKGADAERTAAAWTNLGASFLNRRMAAEAQEAYRRALAITPLHPQALYSLAASLQESGKEHEAGPLLVRLTRIQTRLPLGSLTRLATVAMKGEAGGLTRSEALAALESREEALRDAEWHTAKGILLWQVTPPAELRAHFKRAVELGPELAQPILYLLMLSPPGPQKVEALTLSRQAIARLHSRQALAALQSALESQKEEDLAAEVAARIANLTP